jgi:hypothetical protein
LLSWDGRTDKQMEGKSNPVYIKNWITLVLHLFVSTSIPRQQVFLPLGRASSHLVLCYGIYEQAHIVVIFQTD